MTEDTSPVRILPRSSSWLPSKSFTERIEPKAPLRVAEAGLPSRSAKPIVRVTLPPEKIEPNRITKISGKASVQKRAARSRLKLLMFATVRSRRAFIRSVPERPAGEVQEDVLERRPPDAQVGRLDAQRLAGVKDGADRGRHVAGVDDHLIALVLHRGRARPRAEPGVAQPLHRVEAD